MTKPQDDVLAKIAAKMRMRDEKNNIPVVHIQTPTGQICFSRLPNGDQVQWRLVQPKEVLATLPE